MLYQICWLCSTFWCPLGHQYSWFWKNSTFYNYKKLINLVREKNHIQTTEVICIWFFFKQKDISLLFNVPCFRATRIVLLKIRNKLTYIYEWKGKTDSIPLINISFYGLMNVDKMYITLRLRVGSASEGGSFKYIHLITVPCAPLRR